MSKRSTTTDSSRKINLHEQQLGLTLHKTNHEEKKLSSMSYFWTVSIKEQLTLYGKTSPVNVLSRNPVPEKIDKKRSKLSMMNHNQGRIIMYKQLACHWWMNKTYWSWERKNKRSFSVSTCLQNRYPSISLLLSQKGVYARGLPFISMS